MSIFSVITLSLKEGEIRKERRGRWEDVEEGGEGIFE